MYCYKCLITFFLLNLFFTCFLNHVFIFGTSIVENPQHSSKHIINYWIHCPFTICLFIYIHNVSVK
jgi:hypothetical protein